MKGGGEEEGRQWGEGSGAGEWGQRGACLIDFGPGGGAGVLSMTRHARKCLALSLHTLYFSELFEPGPLPQSWIRWSAPPAGSPGRGGAEKGGHTLQQGGTSEDDANAGADRGAPAAATLAAVVVAAQECATASRGGVQAECAKATAVWSRGVAAAWAAAAAVVKEGGSATAGGGGSRPQPR